MSFEAMRSAGGTAADFAHNCPLELALRTSTLQVAGGWPHMLRRFLEHILVHPCGLAAGGLAVATDDGPCMLFARLSNVLSDGEGHMHAFDWKGAAALKVCLKHNNVLKKAGRTAGCVHANP